MTEFLLDGDSAFCVCVHHVTEHETRTAVIVVGFHYLDYQFKPYFRCNEGCKCMEFRGYRKDCTCTTCRIALDYDQANIKNKA
jgi:hypothetical protein